jgi:Uma2 family endonuclease
VEPALRYDRLVKAPLYAAAGIRETWIVDVDGEAVETYGASSPEGYQRSQRFLRGSPFSPVAFPDLILSIADILG